MKPPRPGPFSPAPGFEAPLEMLSACHGRVGQQCATLRRLAAHLPAHGADAQARAAAAVVIRYFDTSAVHHHEDEEVDLFPALVESMAGSDATCIRALVDGLAREHRELGARWARVRAVLARVSAGEAAPLAHDDVDALVGLYERHVAREEDELLPMAARLLDDATLDAIGRAMRERRGIHSID